MSFSDAIIDLRPFVFTELPGEIRNQIYQLLLTVPRLSTPRPLGDPPLYPSMLRLSKQIHDESRQILYGCNTFLAHPNLLTGMPRLRLYYSTIPHASLIAFISKYHIRVRLDCDPNFSTLQARDAFTGVEELTIEVAQAQYGSSDYKVLRKFEGVRGVKRARIYGSVTSFPEYAAWLEQSVVTPGDQRVEEFDKERFDVGALKKYDIWTVGVVQPTWGSDAHG